MILIKLNLEIAKILKISLKWSKQYLHIFIVHLYWFSWDNWSFCLWNNECEESLFFCFLNNFFFSFVHSFFSRFWCFFQFFFSFFLCIFCLLSNFFLSFANFFLCWFWCLLDIFFYFFFNIFFKLLDFLFYCLFFSN